MVSIKNRSGNRIPLKHAECRCVRFPIAGTTVLALFVLTVLVSGVSVHSQMNWKQAASPSALSPRAAHGILSYDNKLWVFSGASTGVETSVLCASDGTNWTKCTDKAEFGQTALYGYAVFKGEMWILGGTPKLEG